ncbi:MAG: uncharacterized protein JWL84_4660 [Rhodospirillales bacterium]|nr:uncharacterized protein [Rhodospirillales bacterium]
MNDQWQYQIRIELGDLAEPARRDPHSSAIKPLADVLSAHHATIKCQFDAFAGYVAEAERNGTDSYPLYEWTKATIADPEKRLKYLRSFTVYVEGSEVYSKETADPLEAALLPLVGPLIVRLSKYDTNPAKQPAATRGLSQVGMGRPSNPTSCLAPISWCRQHRPGRGSSRE